MVEYCIYIIHGSGTPYIVNSYNSIYDAKEALYNMISVYKTRRKLFFVDNNFYENEFPNSSNGDYYCIKQREVGEWVNYIEGDTDTKDSKILYFHK